MTHIKLNGPSTGTTFDSCTTQDIVSMRQMRLLRAASDAQLKAQQIAGQDALAEAEAEGQRLKAEAVRLGEVKRVLAREAAVTQQEASEAYLRCYTRCQASVSAAKAAEAASRRAEAEAEKRIMELRHQLQASDEALQRQVQVTEAVRARATALTARVAARCMRERTLAHAWGAWRHASWQASQGARLRRARRVAASFAAWRASLAKANEARRAKQREAEREACERTSEALLAAAIAEREDLRRQLAALKAGVAAEREAAAVEYRECSARLTHACSQLLSACRPKEEPVRKEAPERTPAWLTVNTRRSKRQELRVSTCWGGAEVKDPTPTWLRSAAVILQSAHAEAPQEAPAEPKEETEVAAFEGRQMAPHPSRPQVLQAMSSAVVGKLPHQVPLVEQFAAQAAAVAQAREQTRWQSPRALRAAGLAPGGLPVTPHLADPYCATRRATEAPKATTTRFTVVEDAGASRLSPWRTSRRLDFFSEGVDG